jgi:hypothetical protein
MFKDNRSGNRSGANVLSDNVASIAGCCRKQLTNSKKKHEPLNRRTMKISKLILITLLVSAYATVSVINIELAKPKDVSEVTLDMLDLQLA